MCLAVPGKVLSIEGDDPLFMTGSVDFGGVRREVSLACTPDVEIGQYVLVHVGLAISVIDEAEAHKVLGYLEEMGEIGGDNDLFV